MCQESPLQHNVFVCSYFQKPLSCVSCRNNIAKSLDITKIFKVVKSLF